MAEKNLLGRIQHKHDVEENWLKAINFRPKEGELIIYDPDSAHTYPRMKVGNGTDLVTDLPFTDEGYALKTEILPAIANLLTREQMVEYVETSILGGEW